MSRSRPVSETCRPRNETGQPLSSLDCARYTHDMLISLKKIAATHHQTELARLIDAAAAEAEALTRRQMV